MASTSGPPVASPRAHSSDASRRPRETCELAQGRLFRLAGAVREHLLARDELLCEAARRANDAARRAGRRTVSTHYHARAAARVSQGKHWGCPFRGTTLS